MKRKNESISGIGFDYENGGFDTIRIGEKIVPRNVVLASPEMFKALKLAQKWLANCRPIGNIKGPKPLPIIAAALAKASKRRKIIPSP